MEFITYKLEDLLDNFDYLRKPLSTMEREAFKGNYPYYGAQGIIDYVKEYRCNGDYLLIAEDGENLNSRNKPIVQKAKGKFWVNNHAHIVKTNLLADINYIYYLLNYVDIRGFVTGSAQPKLSQNKLNKIKVKVPQINYQEKIGSYLLMYDDLIENNNKRINLLEQMAQELYKEWFIHFRYPGYESVKFENGIPKGWILSSNDEISKPIDWEFDDFSNLATFIRGKNITSAEMVEGNVPVISAGLEPSGYHNEYNVEGDNITISASGANAGYLSYHLTNIWAADCSYCQSDNLWFIYNALKFLQPVISNMQCGSAQPHVYPKNINRLCTIIPDNETIKLYCQRVDAMYKQIKLLMVKNDNLIKQRDSLLPRLMNGSLELK